MMIKTSMVCGGVDLFVLVTRSNCTRRYVIMIFKTCSSGKGKRILVREEGADKEKCLCSSQ